jgi:sec-independent protein translocase protein TatB
MLSGVGFGELAVICIVLIIAVGPERLPGAMRTFGKTLRTLRQASRDIRSATGIDEIMREDFLDPPKRPPVRKPAEPEGPAPVSRADVPATAPAAVPPVEVPQPSAAEPATHTASPDKPVDQA